MKILKAIITVEINIINRRITKFSGVGKKETPQLQKVVKYPKTIPTRTWSKLIGLKFLLSKIICTKTKKQWKIIVAFPISIPKIQTHRVGN